MHTPTIPGPDPDTRTPKFKLPALACDAHTHIFGPGDKYPYAPGRPYTPPDAPLGDFQALHRKLGIGRAVIVRWTCGKRSAADTTSDGRQLSPGARSKPSANSCTSIV